MVMGLDRVVLGLSPGMIWFGLWMPWAFGALWFWVGSDWFDLGLLWTDADVSGWSMVLDWAGLA